MTTATGRPILSRVGAQQALAVSMEDMKAHLKVDHDDDDVMIEALSRAAQQYCEDHCRITITYQRWRYRLDSLADTVVELPRRPLLLKADGPGLRDNVLKVNGRNLPGAFLLVAPSTPDDAASIDSPSPRVTGTEYDINGELADVVWYPSDNLYRAWDANPPLVSFSETPPMAGEFGLTIDFTTGYGPDHQSTPAGLGVAIKMLTANWYLNREANGGLGGPVPFGVDMLLRIFDSGEYR